MVLLFTPIWLKMLASQHMNPVNLHVFKPVMSKKFLFTKFFINRSACLLIMIDFRLQLRNLQGFASSEDDSSSVEDRFTGAGV